MNKILTKLLIGASVMFGGSTFASCDNTLEYTPNPNDSIQQVQLVKNPDVIAWSGQQVLETHFVGSTRSSVDEDGIYSYDFPEEISGLDNITIPSDAIDYNVGSFQSDYGTYVVKFTDGSYEWASFEANNTLIIYINGKVSIKGLGNSFKNGTIYIPLGSELEIENSPSSGSWAVYNAGKFTLPNVQNGLSNIYNIYNSGDLVIGNTNSSTWAINTQINSDQAIYSKGGTVTFNVNDYAPDQYNYSLINVDGKIICDNIVFANGKIKFQNVNGYRDICYLKCTDQVEINKGTNIFGQIDAVDMKFDCGILQFHDNGLANVSNEINVWGSGSKILAQEGSKALVECNKFYTQNDVLSVILGENVYLNAQTIDVAIPANESNYPTDRVNNANKEEYNPACGSVDPDDTPENPSTPTTPESSIADGGSEVEVNLSINDVDNQGDIEHLITKLSIHVRYAGDVKITIPVAPQYYVAQDDLYIFNEHYGKYEDGSVGEYKGAYGSEVSVENPATHTLSYYIDDHEVTLTIEYTENSIVVTTSGITEEVFNYCVENYGDGVNFEIYNYFNYMEKDDEGNLVEQEEKNFEEAAKVLKSYLDDATIEFINYEELPNYYINAFNDFYYTDEEGNSLNNEKGEKDCTVSIVESQEGEYGEGKTGAHLNSGEENVIYKKDGVENDDINNQHGHQFLWGIDLEEHV